jgi:hypothetical protein
VKGYTPEQKQLITAAGQKWLNRTIEGPEGRLFVSVIYITGDGSLEALVFPTAGSSGHSTTLKLLDMKHNYKIVG